MEKVAILLDSTSGLTMEEASKYENIFMIPLYTIFGNDSYKDGVELDTKEFFAKTETFFQKFNSMPTTSQPSIGECVEMYEKLLKDFDHIIYITISNKMSGTYQNGILAKQDYKDKVTVIDSMTTSFGTYFAGIIASKYVLSGKNIDEICKMIKQINAESLLYFVVSDLKHLQRTGRIGAAAATIGNALQLKPILTIKNGEVTEFEKIRNIKKAHKKIIAYLGELSVNEDDVIGIALADADEYGRWIKEEVEKLFPKTKIIVKDLSPVISVNTGPGTVGLFLFKNIAKVIV
ncbi:MAG: DegV family protein [Bacilli bacterium]